MNTKRVMNLGSGMYHVISEPGDRTRYDYFVYRDGVEDFCFMPARSTFRFPQRVNYFDVKGMEIDSSLPITECEELFRLAHKENCNPHTLAECVRTIKELNDANSN